MSSLKAAFGKLRKRKGSRAERKFNKGLRAKKARGRNEEPIKAVPVAHHHAFSKKR